MKRTVSFMLSLLMICYAALPAYASKNQISPWAQQDLERAEVIGYVTLSSSVDYTQPITRLEFIELIYSMTIHLGWTFEDEKDYFDDTDSEAANKLAMIGIIQGTAERSFSPDRFITREEISVLLYRTMNLFQISPDKASLEQYQDLGSIADWARDAVEAIVGGKIMNGISENALGLQEETSIEQAIVLTYRLYGFVICNRIQNVATSFIDAQKEVQQEHQAQFREMNEENEHTTSNEVSFVDARINSLQLIEVYQTPQNQEPLLLFSLDYALKAEPADAVMLVGGMDMDASGWVTFGLPVILVVQHIEDEYVVLGSFATEFSPNEGAEQFQDDFELWLLGM